jgi:diguanylate cyclase (GGDEF)-like protein/PAS domain S-box-containing protein
MSARAVDLLVSWVPVHREDQVLGGSCRHKSMTENRPLEAELDVFLSGRRAVVAALSDNGFRVDLPDGFPLDDHQALAVPVGPETMLDVVVAGDRLAVVGMWERARVSGFAACSVHAVADPDRLLTLSVIDARRRFGVWVAALADDGKQGHSSSELVADALSVPSRPRLAISHKSMTAIITDVDANVTGMLGWSPEQMIGVRSTEFVHPDDNDRAVASWMDLLAHRGTQRVRLRYRCRDGSWLWIEIEQVHNGAENPDEVDVVSYMSDISEEMAAHEALGRREQLFSRLAESLPSGVAQIQQDLSVVYANARLSAILGIAPIASMSDVLAGVADRDRSSVSDAVSNALERSEDRELEVDIAHANAAERRRCALTIAAVDDQEGQPGVLVCVSDITDQARTHRELQVRATTDPLTGVLNRATVMQALDRSLAQAHQSSTGVIFVDIDRFKPVNDRMGHAAGDELLVHVAKSLGDATNGHEVVGRLGGDEFLLLCPSAKNPAHTTRLARRLQQALNQPLDISSGTVDLHASIGVAFNEPGDTCDVLVARADAAMYQAKRGGGGTTVLYRHAAVPKESPALPALGLDAEDPQHGKRTHVRSARR